MKTLRQITITTLALLCTSFQTYAQGGHGISNSYKKTWNRNSINKMFVRDTNSIARSNQAVSLGKITTQDYDYLLGGLRDNYKMNLLACTGVQVEDTLRSLKRSEQSKNYHAISSKALDNCINLFEESLDKFNKKYNSKEIEKVVNEAIDSLLSERD